MKTLHVRIGLSHLSSHKLKHYFQNTTDENG